MTVRSAAVCAALATSAAGVAATVRATSDARRSRRHLTDLAGRTAAAAVQGRLLERVLDGASSLLLLTDEDGVICYASQRAHELLGVDPEALVSQPVDHVISPADRSRVAEVAEASREAKPEERRTVEFAAVLGTGDVRRLEADLTAIDLESGTRGLVWAVRDVSAPAAQDPVGEARHDRLTGLPTRTALVEGLELALARAGRSQSRLAAMLIEVRGFTEAWETVGHRAAEDLLLSTAYRLEAAARPGDLVARVGVDEFAVILDGFGDPDEVAGLIVEALAVLSRPVQAGHHELPVDAILGVALSTVERDTPEDLMQHAGQAIETARENGRDSAVFEPSSRCGATRRVRDLTTDLRDAIRAGQIRAVYQPIVQLDSGDLTGFEALARWDHPERGPISPATFITLAEQSELIVELGRHMLVTACQQMETWRQAAPGQALRIGVNASPRQLAGRTLVEDIRRALRFSGLPPEHLVVEVTESGLHHDMAEAQQVLGRLRDLGVRTAMDDFGTGFSSLAYLRRLPLDILKVDKSFIDDRDGTGRRFLGAIVGLGAQLGLDVLAEGIEEPDQQRAALAAGCMFGQGFLMARPLEVDDATRLVGRSGPVWSPACDVPADPIRVSAS